jgi:hypothetical protein
MNNILSKLFLCFLFILESVNACPGCAGSMNNPKDKYLVYILMGFIALCYIPFYIIYRTIIKHRNFNEQLEDAVQPE